MAIWILMILMLLQRGAFWASEYNVIQVVHHTRAGYLCWPVSSSILVDVETGFQIVFRLREAGDLLLISGIFNRFWYEGEIYVKSFQTIALDFNRETWLGEAIHI